MSDEEPDMAGMADALPDVDPHGTHREKACVVSAGFSTHIHQRFQRFQRFRFDPAIRRRSIVGDPLFLPS
jgi:hypothetical protein